MSIIVLKCPRCDADLKFDDSLEYGYCDFCSTKIKIQKDEVTIINNNFVDKRSGSHIIPDLKKGQYEGELSNGVPNGKGFFMWPDGVNYEGEFKNGTIEGFGRKNYKNGYYEGEFHNNLRSGNGKFIDNDGNIYEGVFKNDMKNGQFHSSTFFMDEPCEEEANYVNDKKEGASTLHFSDGCVIVSEMKNGVMRGEYFILYPENSRDAVIASRGHAVKYCEEGLCKDYYRDGTWEYGKKMDGEWAGETHYSDSGSTSVREWSGPKNYKYLRSEDNNRSYDIKFEVIDEAVKRAIDDHNMNKTSFKVTFVMPDKQLGDMKLSKFIFFDGSFEHSAHLNSKITVALKRGKRKISLSQIVKTGFLSNKKETFEFDIDVHSDLICNFSIIDGRYVLQEKDNTNYFD